MDGRGGSIRQGVVATLDFIRIERSSIPDIESITEETMNTIRRAEGAEKNQPWTYARTLSEDELAAQLERREAEQQAAAEEERRGGQGGAVPGRPGRQAGALHVRHPAGPAEEQGLGKGRRAAPFRQGAGVACEPGHGGV